MSYLVNCLTEKYTPSEVSWQWLLGRLYIVERLVIEFPTEFLPRQRPDGASSESSLEMIGARSKDEEERPQNYDRLLIVAEFAIRAVTNQHGRISRVAKRVFLLAARYAAHLENLISEFLNLLNDLDFTHKKSLKKQLNKIVAEFQLSEQIGRHLQIKNMVGTDISPLETPDVTPVSSPRCTSPATTVVSDAQSDIDMKQNKGQLLVPPNTPIRDCRRKEKLVRHQSYDLPDKNGEDNVFTAARNWTQDDDLTSQKSYDDFASKNHQMHLKSKSMEALDNQTETTPRRTLSKTPVRKSKKSRSRSRSNTPIRIGPVLETDLDEVIKMEEAQRRLKVTGKADGAMSAEVDDDEDYDDLGIVLDSDLSSAGLDHIESPLPRLLSHDLETDIDNVEPDLDTLMKSKYGSGNELDSNLSGNNTAGSPLSMAPKMARVKLGIMPKSLSLDLTTDKGRRKSKRSISPYSHVLNLECLSNVNNLSETPCQNSLSQSKSLLSCASGVQEKRRDRGGGRKGKSDDSKSKKQPSVSSQMSFSMDDSLDYIARTPGTEKPVTFQTEVAMGTPKHSPSHTLDKGENIFLFLW